MGEGPNAPLILNAHAVSNDRRRAPVKEYVEVGAVHQAAPQLPHGGEQEATHTTTTANFNFYNSSQRCITTTTQKFEPSASLKRGTLGLESI